MDAIKTAGVMTRGIRPASGLNARVPASTWSIPTSAEC